MTDHRYASVDRAPDDRGHIAVCSCGWKGPVMTTAGLAGTTWDEHCRRATDVARSTEPPAPGR